MDATIGFELGLAPDTTGFSEEVDLSETEELGLSEPEELGLFGQFPSLDTD